MGYDLHIVREGYDREEGTSYITPEEWLAYVNADKELELSAGYNADISSLQFSRGPVYWEWNAHPADYEPGSRPWFDYWKGSISTKNPDMLIIRKMMKIAGALNGIVQGEGGEIYTEEYVAELEKEAGVMTPAKPVKRPWWKFW